MKIRALLAATAITVSSFAAVPAAMAGPPIPPAPGPLEDYCAAHAATEGKGELPNAFWFWSAEIGDIVDTGNEGGGTILGYSMNPASRTIHAVVDFDLTSVTYVLHCYAMEPGSTPGQAGANPSWSYDTTYTDETGGGGTELGRPAVCNPGKTKLTSNTWFEIPGTEDYRDGKSCTAIAGGYLIPWSSIPTL